MGQEVNLDRMQPDSLSEREAWADWRERMRWPAAQAASQTNDGPRTVSRGGPKTDAPPRRRRLTARPRKEAVTAAPRLGPCLGEEGEEPRQTTMRSLVGQRGTGAGGEGRGARGGAVDWSRVHAARAARYGSIRIERYASSATNRPKPPTKPSLPPRTDTRLPHGLGSLASARRPWPPRSSRARTSPRAPSGPPPWPPLPAPASRPGALAGAGSRPACGARRRRRGTWTATTCGGASSWRARRLATPALTLWWAASSSVTAAS